MTSRSRRDIEKRVEDLEEQSPEEDSDEAIQAAMWEALTSYYNYTDNADADEDENDR